MRGNMKRSGILAAVFFLAALCAIPFMTQCIDREKEEIQITEIPLRGDPEEAEGISLEYAVHWDRKLLWDTVYLPGSKRKAESSFSFCSQEADWPRIQEDGINWMGVGSWGMSSSGTGGVDLDEVYFSALVKDAASRVSPGETKTLELRLADYYEYYPFCLTVESERQNLYYGFGYQLEEGVDILAKLVSLPVSEGDLVAITIQKNEAGNCVGVNSQLREETSGLDNFDGEAWTVEQTGAEGDVIRILDGAFGEQGFYLGYSFSVKEKGESGCGVFYIPYTDQPEARGRYSGAATTRKTLDVRRSRKVWEAENDCGELMGMSWDEEAGLLYLMAAEDGKENLYVLQEGEEFQLRQKLFVAEQSAGPGTEIWGGMRIMENGLLLSWERGSMGSGGFIFLTRENDAYSVFCRGNFPGISSENSEEYGSLFPWEYCCEFDGERLALAAYDTSHSTDVWLGIFRREGETYCGMYRHSSSREPGRYGTSEIYPQGYVNGRSPRSNEPLKLQLVTH